MNSPQRYDSVLKAGLIYALVILLGGCFANNTAPPDSGSEALSGGIGTFHEGGLSTDTNSTSGENDAPAQPLLVEILSDNTPMYTTKELKRGKLVFLDRPYYFSKVSHYSGLCFLQTAMNDKRSTDASFLRFTLSRETTLYIGYDTRKNTLPLWLTEWTDTGEELMIADDNARYWASLPLKLFKRTFSAGTVELGGADNSGSMYVVLLDDGGTGCTLKNDRHLELSWFPNRDKVDGYKIYLEKESGLTALMSVDVGELADPQHPALEFRSWSDLGITGNRACFAISAYLNNVESDLSISKCITI